MLLTDEEIEKAVTGASYLVGATVGLTHHQKVAKAQLKKVVEWGDEDCGCPTNSLAQIDKNRPIRKRRACWKCWQALLEEVK